MKTDCTNKVSKQLIERHDAVSKYLRQQSASISRSKHWEWSSGRTDAELTEEGFRNLGAANYFPIPYEPDAEPPTLSGRIRAPQDVAMDRPARKAVELSRDRFIVNGQAFFLCNRGRKHNYYLDRITAETGPVARMLEIGGGAGLLAALFHAEHGTRVAIVDLPEMLIVSSAFLMTVFPHARILLPNEVHEPLEMDQWDFVLLTPKQVNTLPEKSFDLCVNTASFMEMDMHEVRSYFNIFDKCLTDDGYVFCSNRMRKVSSFFKYPWRTLSDTQDVFVERFRAEGRTPKKNQFADRLIHRCRVNDECLKGVNLVVHEIAKKLFWGRWAPSALFQTGLPPYHRSRFLGYF